MRNFIDCRSRSRSRKGNCTYRLSAPIAWLLIQCELNMSGFLSTFAVDDLNFYRFASIRIVFFLRTNYFELENILIITYIFILIHINLYFIIIVQFHTTINIIYYGYFFLFILHLWMIIRWCYKYEIFY